MHEEHVLFAGVGGMYGLDAYVEEADPVVKLLFYVYGLTADRGQGAVIRV